MSVVFTKVTGLERKKKLQQRCFLMSVPNILDHFFCETRLVLLNAIHFICCADFISKMLLSTLP